MADDEMTLDELLIEHTSIVVTQTMLHAMRYGPPVALKTAYASGIWLGLSIGITDVVAARIVRRALSEAIVDHDGTDEEGQTAVDQLVRAAHAASKT